MIPLCLVSRQALPKDGADGDIFTVQLHQVTTKLEQQVSLTRLLTAALEDSKQREGWTARKLSRCEQRLRMESTLLRAAVEDSLHEEHELQTELKQVHSMPWALPSTRQNHSKSVQSMCNSIYVAT